MQFGRAGLYSTLWEKEVKVPPVQLNLESNRPQMCSAVFYVLVIRTLRYSVQVRPVTSHNTAHWLPYGQSIHGAHWSENRGRTSCLIPAAAASFLAKSKHPNVAEFSSMVCRVAPLQLQPSENTRKMFAIFLLSSLCPTLHKGKFKCSILNY